MRAKTRVEFKWDSSGAILLLAVSRKVAVYQPRLRIGSRANRQRKDGHRILVPRGVVSVRCVVRAALPEGWIADAADADLRECLLLLISCAVFSLAFFLVHHARCRGATWRYGTT